jgi:hypothetical protein
MKQNIFQKASQLKLPPQPDLDLIDPVVIGNTRFSKDRAHRYTLFRYWGDPDDYCVFIGMNPSGADEAAVDPTVNRCKNFARDWGFGALYMLNAFSLRATDSDELMRSSDQVRPKNDYWLKKLVQQGGRVVVAWGKKGASNGRGLQVENILREHCDPNRVCCFGRNQDGSPKHPLYQSANQVPVPYFDKSKG